MEKAGIWLTDERIIFMIIGITGNSGTGKSYISDIIAEYGYKKIDMDKIAHSIYENRPDCLMEIRNSFGDEVFHGKKLNRRALGEIVFKDRCKLELLNEITHKYIMEEAKREMDQKNILLDAPVLIDTKFENLCDKIILVTSDKDTKIKRIMLRDNISYQYAMNRINSQPDEAYLSTKCHYIVDNSEGRNIKEDIRRIMEEIQ